MNVNVADLKSVDPPKADILIVDDKPDNLRLLSAYLKEENYQVRKALNAERSLQAIATAKPDLILLDIQMPDMNGYELCSKLKESPETCDIPIIFISAKKDVFDKGLAFDIGAVDYIVKPFHELEVVVRVRHQITIAQQLKQLEIQRQELEATNQRLKMEIRKRKQLEAKLRQILQQNK